jgi:hypothetical protein
VRPIAAVVAIAVAALPASAEEDRPEVQRMQFVEHAEDLSVSTIKPGGLGKLFDSPAYDALDSGFPSTVVIGLEVIPSDSSTPVAVQVVQRSVVYDLWDEVYVLRLDELGNHRTIKVKHRAEALKYLTTIDDLPIAKLAVVPYEQVFVLQIDAQLNPVSKETLAEVRRWLSQGNGGGLDRGGAFFGSFVSVFWNPKIADADRVVRLRSQPFFRPKP